jgi:maltose O-acetyltransferase
VGLGSALKWDLLTDGGRYLVLQDLLRNWPGELGYLARGRLLGRHFKSAGRGLRIFPGVRILGVQHLSVGVNCWIGYDNYIQANGGVKLGDHVLLGPGVKIWSVNHVFEDPHRPIVEQGYEHKAVVIGDNVWLGADTFVMPGARIGDGVVVAAGSVVGGKDIEPYTILAGNPARKIGSRDSRDPALQKAP